MSVPWKFVLAPIGEPLVPCEIGEGKDEDHTQNSPGHLHSLFGLLVSDLHVEPHDIHRLVYVADGQLFSIDGQELSSFFIVIEDLVFEVSVVEGDDGSSCAVGE